MKIKHSCLIAVLAVSSLSLAACNNNEDQATATKQKVTATAETAEKKVEQPVDTTPMPELNISAESAALYNMDDTKPLYEKSPEIVTPIASITKLMTTYLVLQAIHNKTLSWDETLQLEPLDDKAAVSLYMVTNKKDWTVKDLYAAMLVMSANDAAEALGK